jgi:PEP-CTERM motif
LVGQFSNGSSFWDDGYLWDVSYGQNQIDVKAVQMPEPSSLSMLLIGLAALAFCALRTRIKTQHLS